MPRREVSLSQNDMAAALGLDDTETLRQWRKDGCPHQMRGNRPFYHPRKVRLWLEERAEKRGRASIDRPLAKLDKDDEQARKLAAEATIAEMRLAALQKEMIPAQRFESEFERLVGGFAAVSKGQLQRFERDIVSASTPADARRLIERIQDALMAGMQTFADELDDEATDEPEDLIA